MKKILAFFLGIKEFKSSVTTSQDDTTEYAYDLGREIAHRFTFRKFEQ